MRFQNRRWLVIPTSEAGNVDFSKVHENNPESLRYSIDGLSTFVKYEIKVVENTYNESYIDAVTGEEKYNTFHAGTYGRPSIYNGEYTEYNHADMLDLLETEEWTNPIEE
jgi:hypothetical protein|tara:strand:- start:3703 stop:4032 length:330 start_codon:yes stop_codon:yes gene_type:complete